MSRFSILKMPRLTLLGIVVLASAVPAIAQMTRPAIMPITINRPTTTTAPSERERLLLVYLTHIEDIVAENRARNETDFRAMVEDRKKRAEKLDQAEAAVMAELRAGAKENFGNRLDTETPARVTIYPYIIAESPTSARIVAALLKEGLVREANRVVGALDSQGQLCAPWVEWLERELARQPRTAKLIRRVLWAGGAQRPEYRQFLEADATDNLESLTTLLFETSPWNPRRDPVVNADNMALASRLIGPGHDPQIRVACADYVLGLFNYELAAQTCYDVLKQEYESVLHPQTLSKDDAKADRTLYHARTKALSLLFFGIKGERAFCYIYDQYRDGSSQGSTQPATPGAIPPRFKRLFNTDYRLEYATVDSLIFLVQLIVDPKLGDPDAQDGNPDRD